MNNEIYILIFIGIIIFGLNIFLRIINHFLLRKLKDLPEIDRKYHEGLYSGFDSVRAEYVIGFYESLGLYTSKYDEDGELK